MTLNAVKLGRDGFEGSQSSVVTAGRARPRPQDVAVQSILQLDNLYKVFGPTKAHIRRALDMAQNGLEKEEILRTEGCNVAVRDVSLSIRCGEIFCVMGLSGSGKSTLVRHLNRLIEPTAGKILFRDTDVLSLGGKALRDIRRYNIAMVFQSFALLPHKTVLENVMFGRRIRGEKGADVTELAKNWVNGRLGLRGYDDKYPDELSGGMRQRVGLARALVSEPDVLLMDEAFSALDPLIRSEMQDILLEMQAALRRTIVFITHDIDEAMKIGSRIAIMKDGEVVQVGTPSEIRSAPANDYVRRFFEAH